VGPEGRRQGETHLSKELLTTLSKIGRVPISTEAKQMRRCFAWNRSRHFHLEWENAALGDECVFITTSGT